MASHIIQKATGQVGGEKRVRSFRSWGAAATPGVAWRIDSIFHDSSMVDRPMSCPGAIQIKAIRPADKASFLLLAIEFLMTSHLAKTALMIHMLHGRSVP